MLRDSSEHDHKSALRLQSEIVQAIRAPWSPFDKIKEKVIISNLCAAFIMAGGDMGGEDGLIKTIKETIKETEVFAKPKIKEIKECLLGLEAFNLTFVKSSQDSISMMILNKILKQNEVLGEEIKKSLVNILYLYLDGGKSLENKEKALEGIMGAVKAEITSVITKGELHTKVLEALKPERESGFFVSTENEKQREIHDAISRKLDIAIKKDGQDGLVDYLKANADLYLQALNTSKALSKSANHAQKNEWLEEGFITECDMWLCGEGVSYKVALNKMSPQELLSDVLKQDMGSGRAAFSAKIMVSALGDKLSSPDEVDEITSQSDVNEENKKEVNKLLSLITSRREEISAKAQKTLDGMASGGVVVTSRESIELFKWAVEKDEVGYIEKLIEQGFEVNDTFDEGSMTPLMYCVTTGRLECLELLLKHGADVNHYDTGRSMTVMDYAMNSEKADFNILNALLKRGANGLFRESWQEYSSHWRGEEDKIKRYFKMARNVGIKTRNTLDAFNNLYKEEFKNRKKSVGYKQRALILKAQAKEAASKLGDGDGWKYIVDTMLEAKDEGELRQTLERWSTTFIIMAELSKESSHRPAFNEMYNILNERTFEAMTSPIGGDIIKWLLQQLVRGSLEDPSNSSWKDFQPPGRWSPKTDLQEKLNDIFLLADPVNYADNFIKGKVVEIQKKEVDIVVGRIRKINPQSLDARIQIERAERNFSALNGIVGKEKGSADLIKGLRSHLDKKPAEAAAAEAEAAEAAAVRAQAEQAAAKAQAQAQAQAAEKKLLGLIESEGSKEGILKAVERCKTIDNFDWDFKGEEGKTLLHIAAEKGDAVVVEALLKAGAKLEKEDGNGNTPLHIAVEKSLAATFFYTYDAGVVEVLLKAGDTDSEFLKGVLEKEDEKGNTPLHIAAEKGDAKVAGILLREGRNAGLFSKNKDGNTPLHIAAAKGNAVVARILLEGADVFSQNKEDLTALDLARAQGYAGIDEFISEEISQRFKELLRKVGDAKSILWNVESDRDDKEKERKSTWQGRWGGFLGDDQKSAGEAEVISYRKGAAKDWICSAAKAAQVMFNSIESKINQASDSGQEPGKASPLDGVAEELEELTRKAEGLTYSGYAGGLIGEKQEKDLTEKMTRVNQCLKKAQKEAEAAEAKAAEAQAQAEAAAAEVAAAAEAEAEAEAKAEAEAAAAAEVAEAAEAQAQAEAAAEKAQAQAQAAAAEKECGHLIGKMEPILNRDELGQAKKDLAELTKHFTKLESSVKIFNKVQNKLKEKQKEVDLWGNLVRLEECVEKLKINEDLASKKADYKKYNEERKNFISSMMMGGSTYYSLLNSFQILWDEIDNVGCQIASAEKAAEAKAEAAAEAAAEAEAEAEAKAEAEAAAAEVAEAAEAQAQAEAAAAEVAAAAEAEAEAEAKAEAEAAAEAEAEAEAKAEAEAAAAAEVAEAAEAQAQAEAAAAEVAAAAEAEAEAEAKAEAEAAAAAEVAEAAEAQAQAEAAAAEVAAAAEAEAEAEAKAEAEAEAAAAAEVAEAAEAQAQAEAAAEVAAAAEAEAEAKAEAAAEAAEAQAQAEAAAAEVAAAEAEAKAEAEEVIAGNVKEINPETQNLGVVTEVVVKQSKALRGLSTRVQGLSSSSKEALKKDIDKLRISLDEKPALAQAAAQAVEAEEAAQAAREAEEQAKELEDLINGYKELTESRASGTRYLSNDGFKSLTFKEMETKLFKKVKPFSIDDGMAKIFWERGHDPSLSKGYILAGLIYDKLKDGRSAASWSLKKKQRLLTLAHKIAWQRLGLDEQETSSASCEFNGLLQLTTKDIVELSQSSDEGFLEYEQAAEEVIKYSLMLRIKHDIKKQVSVLKKLTAAEEASSRDKAALSEAKTELSKAEEALSRDKTALSRDKTALSRDKTALSRAKAAFSEAEEALSEAEKEHKAYKGKSVWSLFKTEPFSSSVVNMLLNTVTLGIVGAVCHQLKKRRFLSEEVRLTNAKNEAIVAKNEAIVAKNEAIVAKNAEEESVKVVINGLEIKVHKKELEIKVHKKELIKVHKKELEILKGQLQELKAMRPASPPSSPPSSPRASGSLTANAGAAKSKALKNEIKIFVSLLEKRVLADGGGEPQGGVVEGWISKTEELFNDLSSRNGFELKELKARFNAAKSKALKNEIEILVSRLEQRGYKRQDGVVEGWISKTEELFNGLSFRDGFELKELEVRFNAAKSKALKNEIEILVSRLEDKVYERQDGVKVEGWISKTEELFNGLSGQDRLESEELGARFKQTQEDHRENMLAASKALWGEIKVLVKRFIQCVKGTALLDFDNDSEYENDRVKIDLLFEQYTAHFPSENSVESSPTYKKFILAKIQHENNLKATEKDGRSVSPPSSPPSSPMRKRTNPRTSKGEMRYNEVGAARTTLFSDPKGKRTGAITRRHGPSSSTTGEKTRRGSSPKGKRTNVASQGVFSI